MSVFGTTLCNIITDACFFSVDKMRKNQLQMITDHIRRMGKVMFSQVCVSPQETVLQITGLWSSVPGDFLGEGYPVLVMAGGGEYSILLLGWGGGTVSWSWLGKGVPQSGLRAVVLPPPLSSARPGHKPLTGYNRAVCLLRFHTG